MAAQELAAAVQALAHPNRRAIADELGNGDRPVAGPTRKLRVSQPAVSRHLRLLRQAGPADSQTVGARHLYRLRGDGDGTYSGCERTPPPGTGWPPLTQAGHSPIICPDASTP